MEESNAKEMEGKGTAVGQGMIAANSLEDSDTQLEGTSIASRLFDG